jgi:hypothetical protein
LPVSRLVGEALDAHFEPVRKAPLTFVVSVYTFLFQPAALLSL